MWDLGEVMSKDLTLIKLEQLCLLFTDLYVCILLSQESIKYRGRRPTDCTSVKLTLECTGYGFCVIQVTGVRLQVSTACESNDREKREE